MSKKNSTPTPASSTAENPLRKQAEERLAQELEKVQSLSLEDAQTLAHELRVHQVELEMQNEELRRSQIELQQARDRYIDLYDFAPVGYLTLSEKGIIREANLTSAILFGAERGKLIGLPFSRLVAPEDRDSYYLKIKQLIDDQSPLAFEIRALKNNESKFWARIEANAQKDSAEDGTDAVQLSVVVSDISVRKSAEAERERLTTNIEDKNRELKSIVYAASHDLRSPLITVQGYGKYLEKYFSEMVVALEKASTLDEFREVEKVVFAEKIPHALQ